MKRTVTALDARRRLGELLESVYLRGDEVIIERAGKPMAVVIPAERYATLERNREQMWDFIEKAQAGNDGLADADVAALVESAIADVRQESRAAASLR